MSLHDLEFTALCVCMMDNAHNRPNRNHELICGKVKLVISDPTENSLLQVQPPCQVSVSLTNGISFTGFLKRFSVGLNGTSLSVQLSIPEIAWRQARFYKFWEIFTSTPAFSSFKEQDVMQEALSVIERRGEPLSKQEKESILTCWTQA